MSRPDATRDGLILADAQRGAKPPELAEKWGLSVRTIYTILRGQCVQPRRQRRDAGKRRCKLESHLWCELLSLILRDDYAPEIALEIMEANGRLAAGQVTASWVNSQLRQLGITRRRAGRNGPTGPRVFVRRESTRPNARHQVDATPAASIYIDTSEDVTYEPRSRLLKDRHLRGKTPVSIFGLVDEYSRCIYLRAYPTETWESWHDFLFRAWSEKENPHDFPFCGLPAVLRPDKGSGLTNHAARRAMSELGIKVIAHEAGEPWKKGKIEAALRRYQRLCEPATHELKFASFAELNLFLERAARWMNSRVHSATGAAPFGLWLSIRDEDLWHPPTWDQWQRLCYRQEEVRVREDLVIVFGPSTDREEVELPYDPAITPYVGKRITVLYAPGAEDPVLLRLPALSALDLPGREMPVPRVRPGARAPSQADSNRVTPGQLVALQGVRTDTSHLSRTAHMDSLDRVWAVPTGGQVVTLRSETMFRQDLGLFAAVGYCQKNGTMQIPPSDQESSALHRLFAGRQRVSTVELDALGEDLQGTVGRWRSVALLQARLATTEPLSDGDVAYLDELYAGRQTIPRGEFDAALDELARVKGERRAMAQEA